MDIEHRVNGNGGVSCSRTAGKISASVKVESFPQERGLGLRRGKAAVRSTDLDRGAENGCQQREQERSVIISRGQDGRDPDGLDGRIPRPGRTQPTVSNLRD